MFNINRITDPTECRLLQNGADEDVTRREIHSAIRKQIIAFQEAKTKADADEALKAIKDLSEVSRDLRSTETRLEIRKDTDGRAGLIVSALSFAGMLLFESRHVIPRAASWIRKV